MASNTSEGGCRNDRPKTLSLYVGSARTHNIPNQQFLTPVSTCKLCVLRVFIESRIDFSRNQRMRYGEHMQGKVVNNI